MSDADSSSSKPRFGVPDAMALVGGVCVAVAAGLWSVVAGLATTGVLLLVSSLILMRGER